MRKNILQTELVKHEIQLVLGSDTWDNYRDHPEITLSQASQFISQINLHKMRKEITR